MQGFNMGRYIPPDAAGTTTSGNRLHGKKHALGARAAKLASQGILIVRFEMPFAVWCGHCTQPTLVGQGVRFNAEKRRAGSYHSTPVWAFRLRHSVCGGEIEMRTDPQHGDFVVVSGARRRDYGDRARDGGGGGGGDGESLVASGFAIATQRERAEERETAFGKLEKTIKDREQVAGAEQRIDELQDAAERQWEDPYSLNRKLRKAFRAGRHTREKETAKAEELKERMGLGIELLPEREEDAKRAKLVDFGGLDIEGHDGVDKALAKPLFDSGPSRKGKKDDEKASKSVPGKLKSEIAADRMREQLVSEVVSNTRAAKDPFLDFGSRESTPKGPARFPGLKRKRPAAEEAPVRPEPATNEEDTPKEVVGITGLVNYDSESD
ncbi:CWC16 protein [Chaetomium fimeti]|uniref:CWC16 protein n=1 Tax=Chaetomium fimeti TaxID=1854472 RepID=A0AAE0LP52_9PEZI|nr:CWC16 protein [Chaetomium fimeti]